jgi:predicted acetyltransferase
LSLHQRVFGESVLDNLRHAPTFQYEEVRGGFYRGTLVSLARVRFATLRYGRVQWRVGIISDVATDPAYQRRGFAHQVMQDTLAYVAVGGAHLAILNAGVTGYYQRFGFSSFLPHYKLTIPTEAALSLPPAADVYNAATDDSRALAALYQRHWGGRVTLLREPALWAYRIQEKPPFAAFNANGQIAGYSWRHSTHEIRAELVADTPTAALALVRREGDLAYKERRNEIHWIIPPDDPIISYLRPHVDVTLSAQYRPSRGWMARMMDSASFIHILNREMTTHLKEMHPQLSDSPTIRISPESVTVEFGHMRLRLIPRDFIQLVFGTLNPEMLAAQLGVSYETVEWLGWLFPPRSACVAAWDW